MERDTEHVGYVRPTPLAVRLPKDLIAWLYARKSQTGMPVNRMIVDAVWRYRNEYNESRERQDDAAIGS